MNAQLSQAEDLGDKHEPFSLIKKSPDRSHIQTRESLFGSSEQSGEFTMSSDPIEPNLIDQARYALRRMQQGSEETPVIAILAEEQLERILKTIEVVHKTNQINALFHIDPAIQLEDVLQWSLKNRLTYCEHLRTLDQSERTRKTYTGWQRRTLGVQIEQLRMKFPHFELPPPFQDILTDP